MTCFEVFNQNVLKRIEFFKLIERVTWKWTFNKKLIFGYFISVGIEIEITVNVKYLLESGDDINKINVEDFILLGKKNVLKHFKRLFFFSLLKTKCEFIIL